MSTLKIKCDCSYLKLQSQRKVKSHKMFVKGDGYIFFSACKTKYEKLCCQNNSYLGESFKYTKLLTENAV